ncbi:hypothetical protein B5C34_03310 [Pacificimonas flava]|uniref:Uncharacterized protein n=2 Tax=Pacificimonas TaxID=1960290 RepID=A0A219B2I2_9SPHN|nr:MULTISPECIES: hypothetical protein [Pacificimonas]MBZ6377753.1 hypothetical protein [Pacificimonas aurantium]OWV32572.1 hypothetical protein B5C34_03310 [Pacificimonas flava]
MTSRILFAAVLAAIPLAGTGTLPEGLAFPAAAQAESATALANSAEAKLVEAAYRTADEAAALATLEAALAEANRALALAPAHENARLQKAAALGYRAKLTRSRSDAKAARALFREIVTDNPRSAAGWAGLGGWHGEAVTNIGKFMAGTMLGAKTDSALEAFSRAHRLAPDDPVISTLYAINAIGLKERDSAAEIRALLEPVARGTGGGPLAELMRANARKLLGVIDDPDALRRNAYDMRPFDRFV